VLFAASVILFGFLSVAASFLPQRKQTCSSATRSNTAARRMWDQQASEFTFGVVRYAFATSAELAWSVHGIDFAA
jgi:hypothetical protein